MVELSEISIALSSGDGFSHYYDRIEDRIIMIAEYDTFEEDDGLREVIENDESDRFVYIDQFMGYDPDWKCMERFVLGIEDESRRHEFMDAISGKGAFRRFRILAERYDLLEEWYGFKDRYWLSLAREWCEDNDVPFSE
ncbi:MAG: UPF0158 family protein [archaeon]|nr:UPF0158 family protein [archaeon]